ncbi:MAG TPA: hypothetical protein VK610_09185 [Rhodothermales bacterium]|nr:hypothetical protein [Rhodothermales bacterium]
MKLKDTTPIPPGWVGGFAESNPAFAYPKPNLSSLPMLGNMDNIVLLQRQWPVKWPEFSWLTVPGQPASRCFQMFAPYISRLGYTDEGRVYSIICPQQGAWLGDKVCMNVEVTVTGQRGWVNETTRELAGDLTVEGRIWFTPGQNQGAAFQDAWILLKYLEPHFPMEKENAIRVTTHKRGNPNQPIFPILKGEGTRFESPDFAKHPEAWTVGNLDVEIGPIKKINDPVVDDFNELVMEAFNLASGNMLLPGNVLTWNVWFTEPKLVNQTAWREHAERWRKSIDTHHGSPDGPGTKARYFNGAPFSPLEAEVERVFDEIIKYVEGLL